MNTFFICCIVGGLVIPVLDVFIGAFGGFLDLDLDLDGDTGFDGPFPVNIMSISFSAVVFGAVGKICLPRLHPVFTVLLALAAGLLGGWALGRFVLRPLKRSNPRAHGIQDLLWKEGVVKLGIRPDFVGTITVHSATGSLVTYSAKPAPWVTEEIPVGQPVLIVEIDEGKRACVVCPLENIEEIKARLR